MPDDRVPLSDDYAMYRKKKPALTLGNANSYDVAQPAAAPAKVVPTAPAPFSAIPRMTDADMSAYHRPPPSQLATTVREADPGAYVASMREADLANKIPRLRYLQSPVVSGAGQPPRNTAAAGINVDQMVLDRLGLHDEVSAYQRANQPPRSVLEPTDNAAIQKAKTDDLMKQLSVLGKNGDEGYNRALQSFGARGLTSDPYDPAYAKLGSDMTKRQESGRAADIMRSDAAMGEYRRIRDTRMDTDRYNTDINAATRGANVAGVQAQEAEAKQRALMAQMTNDPAFLDAYKKSALTGVQNRAEQGQFDLEQKRANRDIQKRDIEGSKYLDKNAEELFSQTIPTLNQLSDTAISEDSLPAAKATAQGIDSLLARLEILPPEAQNHYRQKILSEFGNPSLAEYDSKSKAHGVVGMVSGLGFYPKKREAAQILEKNFLRLRSFLFPGA